MARARVEASIVAAVVLGEEEEVDEEEVEFEEEKALADTNVIGENDDVVDAALSFLFSLGEGPVEGRGSEFRSRRLLVDCIDDDEDKEEKSREEQRLLRPRASEEQRSCWRESGGGIERKEK